MTAATKLPHTADARPATRREANLLPRKGSNSARASLGFPLLGDKVRFQRTTDQDFETGFVTARIFGTCEIEIEDMQGKRLRLAPDRYKDFNHMPALNDKWPPQAMNTCTQNGGRAIHEHAPDLETAALQ